jgi:hypothetical protein
MAILSAGLRGGAGAKRPLPLPSKAARPKVQGKAPVMFAKGLRRE